MSGLPPLAGGTSAPSIRTLQAEFAKAADLLNAALGEGAFTEASLEAVCADPSQCLLGAHVDGELVAVASARLVPPEGLSFYARFGEHVLPLLGSRRVGSLHQSAVVPSMRGRGLGQALARARLAWLAQQGADYAVGVAWLSGLAHTSQPVFEKLGFQRLGLSEQLFFELSSAQGWGCPVCGHPCRCGAALYGRPLAAGEP